MKERFNLELLSASELGKRLGVDWRVVHGWGESREIVRFENQDAYYGTPKWLYVWSDCLYEYFRAKGTLDEEDMPEDIQWYDYEYYQAFAKSVFLPRIRYDHVFLAVEGHNLAIMEKEEAQLDGIRVAVYRIPVPSIDPSKLRKTERWYSYCSDCNNKFVACSPYYYFLNNHEALQRLQCPYCNSFKSHPNFCFNTDYKNLLFEGDNAYGFKQLYPLPFKQSDSGLKTPQKEVEQYEDKEQGDDNETSVSRPTVFQALYDQLEGLQSSISNCEELIIENADAFDSPEELAHYARKFEGYARPLLKLLETYQLELDQLDTEMDKLLIQHDLDAVGAHKHI